jgi:hypothetical protein
MSELMVHGIHPDNPDESDRLVKGSPLGLSFYNSLCVIDVV